MNNLETKKLVEVSILIAIASVVAFIAALSFMRLPNGGAVSFAPLILAIIAIRYGFKYGVISVIIFAIIYSIHQAHFAMPWVLILDYILGHLPFAFAAFFPNIIKERKYVTLVVILFAASTIRVIPHTVSGVISFRMFYPGFESIAPDDIWVGSLWMWSMVYNMIHTYLSFVMSAIVGIALLRPLSNVFYNQDE